MRKKLFALFAAVALVLTSGGSARAASNGWHNQSFACDSGGTFIALWLYYEVSGVGTDQVNFVYLNHVSWSTAPSAKLNRISVFGLNDPISGGDDINLYEYGGSSGSLNDVPSSHDSADLGRGFFFENGDPGTISVNFWGGVGDSTAYCQVNHHVA
jgi:hypothetical protein